MALIGTIRKNGWILIATMVLALGGFILMDVVSNSQRYSAADINTLGKVGDTEIKRSEFETYQQLVYSNMEQDNSFQIRDQMWNYFVERAVVEKEAEKMGLGVGKEELLDLQFGLNISPVVADRFKNPDGQPNRATLNSIKTAIEQGQFTDPKNRAYWAIQEKEVIKARLQEKITNVVNKGLYTPKWQAELTFKENNERRDFLAVRVGYDKIKDEEAQLTDADYEAFLEENPRLYNQDEERRVVTYATINVVPTSADSANARDGVAGLLDGFRNAKSDSIFVTANAGIYGNQFMGKDRFLPSVADSIMNRSIGTIVGPIFNGGEWSLIKILDRKVLPDSVRARHILLREASPANKTKADSLVALIKSGQQRFDSLAINISQDPGSGRKGGDLGWFTNGAMVPEFNDVCFNTGEQGKLYTVATQFGWHIIEITGKKFIKNESSIKVAMVGRRIEPSKTTQQAAKDKAVALVQQAKSITDLETLAAQQNIPVQTTQPIKVNEFNLGVALGANDDARSIVRWAYEDGTSLGSISKEVFAFGDPSGGYFDSKYVVAALKSILPKGEASVATLKGLPEAQTRVKNMKKAAIIKSKLQNTTELAAIAAQWEAKVDTLRGANMLQTSGEPRIMGTIFSLETGKVGGPVVGNSGVAFVQPTTDITQPQIPADLTMFRRQVTSQAVGNVRMNLMKSLLRDHKVEDNRFRFW